MSLTVTILLCAVVCTIVSYFIGYWQGGAEGFERGEVYGREGASMDEWETIHDLRSTNSDLEKRARELEGASELDEQSKLRRLLRVLDGRWDATGSTTLLTRQEWIELHKIAAAQPPRQVQP
jgi:hypothetical protein